MSSIAMSSNRNNNIDLEMLRPLENLTENQQVRLVTQKLGVGVMKQVSNGQHARACVVNFGTNENSQPGVDHDEPGYEVSISDIGSLSDVGYRLKILETESQTHKTEIKALEEDSKKKDTKISALEEDSKKKDTKISALEEDSKTKDTKISALEEDCKKKDTKIVKVEKELKNQKTHFEKEIADQIDLRLNLVNCEPHWIQEVTRNPVEITTPVANHAGVQTPRPFQKSTRRGCAIM